MEPITTITPRPSDRMMAAKKKRQDATSINRPINSFFDVSFIERDAKTSVARTKASGN